MLLRNDGPLWYRGLANQDISNNQIDRILASFQSKKIVIGHTIIDEIQPPYDAKVITINVHHAENKRLHGLLNDNTGFYGIGDNLHLRKIADRDDSNG